MAYSLWIWWNVLKGARIILIPNWLKTVDYVNLASLFALIYVMVLNVAFIKTKRDSETVDAILTSIEVRLDLAFIYTTAKHIK